jgi:hypothetical protein
MSQRTSQTKDPALIQSDGLGFITSISKDPNKFLPSAELTKVNAYRLECLILSLARYTVLKS